MRKNRITFFDIANNIAMGLVIMTIVYPFLHVLSVSLSDSGHVLQHTVSFYPKGFTFKSYELIFSNNRLVRALFNSFKYVTLGTAINMTLTTIFAYPLSKNQLMFNKFFKLMVVFTMLFSAGLIPKYLLVTSLGMIDTIWAIVIPDAIGTFNLLIVMTYFKHIPNEIEESVDMDGGSVYTKLFRIVIPLSKPTLAAIMLFYIVHHWNSFFDALIYLMDEKKWPLTMILREMIIQSNINNEDMDPELFVRSTPQGIKYAVIFVSVLPMMMIYPFMQKYFVKGIMIGGVKG